MYLHDIHFLDLLTAFSRIIFSFDSNFEKSFAIEMWQWLSYCVSTPNPVFCT